MNRKKLLIIILAPVAAILAAILLFLCFFDLKGLIEKNAVKALRNSKDVKLQIKASPALKLWFGAFDGIDLSARDMAFSGITINSLVFHADKGKIDPMKLRDRKNVSKSIESLNCRATVTIDEENFSRALNARPSPYGTLSVNFHPDMVKLNASTPIASITASGNFAITDGVKINFIMTGKEGQDNGIMDGILKMINPIIDLERMNMASSALGSMPEEEKKKWDIRITQVRAGEKMLTVDFTVVKKR